MKTDIEIAREAVLKPIAEIASEAGIPVDKLEPYGKYIAKLPYEIAEQERIDRSKLILVTAITPTKAGIGKTTTCKNCNIINTITARLPKDAIYSLKESILSIRSKKPLFFNTNSTITIKVIAPSVRNKIL